MDRIPKSYDQPLDSDATTSSSDSKPALNNLNKTFTPNWSILIYGSQFECNGIITIFKKLPFYYPYCFVCD